LEEDNAIPSRFTGAFAGCLFLFFHLLIFHPFSLTFLLPPILPQLRRQLINSCTPPNCAEMLVVKKHPASHFHPTKKHNRRNHDNQD
jgi:hypothetical protein